MVADTPQQAHAIALERGVGADVATRGFRMVFGLEKNSGHAKKKRFCELNFIS